MNKTVGIRGGVASGTKRVRSRWVLGLGFLFLFALLLFRFLPSQPEVAQGLAAQGASPENQAQPVERGAMASSGVGLVSSIKGTRTHGEAQLDRKEPYPSRAYTVAIEAGKQGWSVPGAQLTLRSSDGIVVDAVCDDGGIAQIQWPVTRTSIDDERLHWSVTCEEFGVEQVFPFDPEEPKPRLCVGAHLVIRGRLESAYVDEWPYPTIYLEPIGEGRDVPRYATCLAHKGGSFQMLLPLEQLRDSMTFVVNDSFSVPLRKTITPTALRLDLGTIELSEGVVLRGVVESKLKAPYGSGHVSAYLNEYGDAWTESPNHGGRVVDGELCSGGGMVPVEQDGSFVFRGLARRRYRVVAEAPGNLRFPGGREEAMLSVDLRERSATSPPLRLEPWWSTVHCQLRVPEGRALPEQVLVHGPVNKREVLRGRVPVDSESGSFWFVVDSSLAQEALFKFSEGFEDVRIKIPALYAQQKHGLDLVLTPDSKIRQDLVLQLTGPQGSRISRVAGQEIAVRMSAYRMSERGLWEAAEKVVLEPQGKDWVVRDLTPGRYRFQVFGMGYKDPDLALVALQTDVEVQESPLEPKRLQFALGGRVHVRLRDSHGNPVPNARVEILLPNGQPPLESYWKPNGPTDPGRGSLFQGIGRESGSIASISALPPGRYIVRPFRNWSEPTGEDQEFEIRMGEITEVTVLCR